MTLLHQAIMKMQMYHTRSRIFAELIVLYDENMIMLLLQFME